MQTYPICFPKGIRPIRFERTEIDGLIADYFFCREQDRSYSVSVYCEGREARLPCFTSRRLVAEAFYLLIKEERVFPASLAEVWTEFAAELVCR
jgi:hypothetical protein